MSDKGRGRCKGEGQRQGRTCRPGPLNSIFQHGAGISALGPCRGRGNSHPRALLKSYQNLRVPRRQLQQLRTRRNLTCVAVAPECNGTTIDDFCFVFPCFDWAKPEPSTVTNPQGYVIMRGSERRRSIWKIYNCSCPSALSYARLLADNASNLHAAGITMKCCVAGLVGPRPGRARAAIHLSLLGQSEGPGFDPTQHSEKSFARFTDCQKTDPRAEHVSDYQTSPER